MISHTNNTQQNTIYFGLHSVVNKYSWRWTDNSPFSFPNWAYQHPNPSPNFFDYRCGIFYLNGQESQDAWIDSFCTRYFGSFVCKKQK